MPLRLARRGRVALGCGLVLVPLALVPIATAQEAPLTISVLSNRADLVSAGDALVRLGVPTTSGMSVEVDGRDVTGAFVERPNGKVDGLLTGLKVGENRVRVRVGGQAAALTITNHPQGGPVFSGKQVQPWTCSEGAKDAQCNRPPEYGWFYKSTGGSGLQPYDPENPPDDVATTTSDTGADVPFIVREEVGVLARDQYRIAVLHDPKAPAPRPWAPQKSFNRKMVITHGASCDTHYQMAQAPDVLVEDVLARGYVVMSHALDNAGHNCNIVTQAESLVMTKEKVVEQLGPLRYTIGTGCSGGALAQQQVANAYPGVYQGITPACSFTDSFSSGMQKEDYNLLRRYYENPQRWEPGVVWTPPQIANVEGHPNLANPITFTTVIPDNADPSRSCVGVPPEEVFSTETQKGVRCSIQDYMFNVFGERKGFNDGKAGRPASNVGIQYGLSGLRSGLLTPAQFVDVNVKVGSRDVDGDWQSKRRFADRPALARSYRSGAVNTASNLDQVAIIDLRGPDPGAFHDVYRTYAMRDRLLREHGTAENQVLWRGQVALFGDVSYEIDSIFAMDRWLAVVEADRREVPLARKVIEAKKKAGVTERCTNGAGVDLPASVCDATVESYSTPRFEAGMPVADDTIECRLTPLRRDDYLPVQFTFEQWAALREVFPHGVCDYSKPGVDDQDTIPWMTYAGVIGGSPMPEPPRSRPLR